MKLSLVKKTGLVVLVIFSGFIFYACKHKLPIVEPAIIHHDSTDTTGVQVEDTTVCFQRDVLPVFLSSCAMSGCHDAISRKDGYNLTTYANIIARGLVKYNSGSSKLFTVCRGGSMPQYPISKLDSTQLSFIRRWIDMGAPNDTNCIVKCDTTIFTYSGAIAPMMKSNCNSCHSTAAASGAGGGIVLDNYNALLVQAQNGKLVGTISHNTGYSAMPKSGAKLTDCKITIVKKWIAAGAKNN